MTRVREADEYAAFVRRIMRSFSRRASGDVEALGLLGAVAAEADAALTTAIIDCHSVGYSYAEIAARLGCTRQAVHQKVQRQQPLSPDEAVAS